MSRLQRRRKKGALLLETVLALGLLVAAASVIVGGLSSSVKGADRLRVEAHAANLAVTVHSRVAIGELDAVDSTAEKFGAPFIDFTWEVKTVTSTALEGETEYSGGAASRPETVGTKSIEVVIRHPETGIVHRLTRFLPFFGVGDPELRVRESLDPGRVRGIKSLFQDG